MSLQSLLHYGFGLRDQEYLKTEYVAGRITIHIRTKSDKLRCSKCGSEDVVRKGKVFREFRTVNIGMKPVYFHAEIQRLGCRACGAIRQEKIHFADEKKLSLMR